MIRIALPAAQHPLEITRKLDTSGSIAAVHNQAPTDLKILLWGDAHPKLARDLVVCPKNLHAPSAGTKLVSVGDRTNRLEACGPSRVVVQITQIYENAVCVLRWIRIPARHRNAIQFGNPAADMAQAHGIMTVRQLYDLRYLLGWVQEPPATLCFGRSHQVRTKTAKRNR